MVLKVFVPSYFEYHQIWRNELLNDLNLKHHKIEGKNIVDKQSFFFFQFCQVGESPFVMMTSMTSTPKCNDIRFFFPCNVITWGQFFQEIPFEPFAAPLFFLFTKLQKFTPKKS